MWFTKKKDYDPYWAKSVAKLLFLWLLFTVLFSSCVIVILSNDFFYQSKVHIFSNYIDISRLVRLEMFLVQRDLPKGEQRDLWAEVLTESQADLSPNLYNGEIFKIDKKEGRAKVDFSLNLIDIGRSVPESWFNEALQSVFLHTYVWHTLSRHFIVVGMPVLDAQNSVDLDRHVAFSWRVPYYKFSFNWFHLAIIFFLLLLVSLGVFFFIFLPYLQSVYEPDIQVIEKGQGRFDSSWRRLRQAQSLLLQLEDD